MFKKGDIAVALFESNSSDLKIIVKKYDYFIVTDVRKQDQDGESIKTDISDYFIRVYNDKGNRNFCHVSELRQDKINKIKEIINAKTNTIQYVESF